MSELRLKTDFDQASIEAWLNHVEKGLRGRPFETLNQKTEDGIKRGPLKSAKDLPSSLERLSRSDLPKLEGRAWHVAAPVRDPNLRHANEQLLEDLKGGASFVRLESTEHIKAPSDLKHVLEGVITDLVPVQIVPNPKIDKILEFAVSNSQLASCHLYLGLDPISNFSIIENIIGDTPKTWRLMGINASEIHEAGGTAVQELAVLSGAIAEAMRAHGGNTVCNHLVIDLASDCDAHLTIAKFRAARRLVHRIADAFEADGKSIPLNAVTSLRMMQTTDAWTNLLRTMSATMGAVVGGADAVTTRPFTDGLGHATPFAHRVARNMQLMMMEESQLGQVSDAAFGSYWHESQTDQLAQKAWRTFQDIESAGGLTAYRDSGALEAALEASKHARADRQDPILGVTLHPPERESPPEVRP